MRRTPLLFGLAFLWTAMTAHAQVAVPFDPPVGTTYLLDVTTEQRGMQGTSTNRQQATLTVAEENDAGVVLEWRPVAPDSGDASGLSALLSRAGDFVLRVQAGPDGDVSLLNEADVTERFMAVRDTLITRILDQQGVPEASRAAARGAMEQNMTPDRLIGQSLDPLRSLLLVNGLEVPQGDTLRKTMRLPNPVTPELMTTRLALTVTAVDEDAGTATLAWTSEPDARKLSAALSDLIAGAALQAALDQGQTPDEVPEVEATLQDRAEQVVDLETGMTRTLTLDRRFSLNGMEQTGTTVIEVTEQ